MQIYEWKRGKIRFQKQVGETKTNEINPKKNENGEKKGVSGWGGEKFLPVGEMGAWETVIPRHDLMG